MCKFQLICHLIILDCDKYLTSVVKKIVRHFLAISEVHKQCIGENECPSKSAGNKIQINLNSFQ